MNFRGQQKYLAFIRNQLMKKNLIAELPFIYHSEG
jgi:hypothetical protein